EAFVLPGAASGAWRPCIAACPAYWMSPPAMPTETRQITPTMTMSAPAAPASGRRCKWRMKTGLSPCPTCSLSFLPPSTRRLPTVRDRTWAASTRPAYTGWTRRTRAS
ncbi:hypothetical protein BFDFBN_BFDFBN_06105, partial [Dysosmobacter welbionis]